MPKVFNGAMNELTPAAVIVEAHRILKGLLNGSVQTSSEYTTAALNWLENHQMIESMLDELGQLQYDITAWGRVALLGHQSA